MALEDLAEYGIEHMDDDAIRAFLTNQSIGVLGLPAGDAPYLLPMSYGYTGEDHLYFTFVVGSGSTKRELSEHAEAASFLVYRAPTAFTWQSVRLEGRIEPVPDEAIGEVRESMSDAWRPELFHRAQEELEVLLCQFVVTDWSGIKQTGLPPGFDE